MKYIVYLTTNIVNLHIYVGVHKTENPEIFDGYIGNGINIFKSNSELRHPKIPFCRAVKKYGYDSFKRLTLKVFDTEEAALDLEAEIVNEEFIKRDDTYNITLGGGMPPKLNKVIYLYDFNGNFIKEWESSEQASKELNLYASSIGRSALYKRTSGNYLWSFEKYDMLDIAQYHIYKPKIPVYLYDNNKKYLRCYESMSECCRDLNVDLSRVQRGARLGNSVNGYYLSLTLSNNFIEPKFDNLVGTIHQYDIDGKYIKSYIDGKELKRLTGISEYEVNRSIKMGSVHKNSIWIRGLKLESVQSKREKVKTARKIGQYTKEGELVKIFNTLREARKEFPNVSKVLSGIANHCHGYLFKYMS